MDKAEWAIVVKELFDRYYVRMCEFAYRLLDCRETARDVAQDAFATLLESQSKVGSREPGAIKSYLYGMVRHAALNRIRHRKITERIHRVRRLPAAEEARILQDMIHSEILGELHAALEALPKGCSRVCKMAYLEGKNNREIAETLGVSINTIKTQKQRALSLLRDKLSPQIFTLLVALLLR